MSGVYRRFASAATIKTRITAPPPRENGDGSPTAIPTVMVMEQLLSRFSPRILAGHFPPSSNFAMITPW